MPGVILRWFHRDHGKHEVTVGAEKDETPEEATSPEEVTSEGGVKLPSLDGGAG